MTNRLILCSSVSLLIASCHFFSGSVSVRVTFPELPISWTQALGRPEFRIVYPDGSGGVIRQTAPPEGAMVALPKISGLPVAAYPVFPSSQVQLFPCGAVFPLHEKNNKTLPLLWEHGFAAETLLIISVSPRHLEAFNASRFCLEVLRRSQGNPWVLDQAHIVEALRFGGFSLLHIQPRDTHNLEISAPVGLWLSTNMLDSSEYLAVEGLLVFPEIHEGHHSFFMAESGARVDLSIGPEGWSALDFSRDIAESGSW